MLAIAEFNAAFSDYRRRLAAGLGAAMASSIVYFAVILSFRPELRGFLTSHFSPFTTEILAGLTPLPVLVFVVGWIAATERRTKRDYRLICPSCGKSLLNLQAIVVATRNCGHCGKRVLAEPEPFD